MFTDARTLPNGYRLATDVCVIGAGAAGITLAREFNGKPFQVAILEGGSLDIAPDAQSLNSGFNVGLPYFPLDMTHARCFGGTTEWWGGHCRPLSEFDFEAKEWIPYSGWPITKPEVQSYYKRAETMCSLPFHSWINSLWELKFGLKMLPLNEKLFETRVAQLVHPPSLSRFGIVYRDEVRKSKNVNTYLNANVTNIKTDRSGKNVTGLEVACLDGPRFSVTAKVFILATGGLENPRLLLASNRVRSKGVGNENDLVGRFFLEHPRFDAGAFIPSSTRPPVSAYGVKHLNAQSAIKGYVGTSPALMSEKQIVDVQLRLETELSSSYQRARNSRGMSAARRLSEELANAKMPDRFGKEIMNVAADIDQVLLSSYWWAFERQNVHRMSIATRVAPAPNPDSRVTLTEQRDALGVPRIQLDWRLSEIDKRSARVAMETFANEVGHKGLGRVQITFEDDGNPRNWPSTLAGGWHTMGTTRMSDSPKRGVVDRNCRVHGMSNLWIAGCSVFPTAGSGTPTMLLIALASRLAEHVTERMG